jgi:large subunit ribosomal protein L32
MSVYCCDRSRRWDALYWKGCEKITRVVMAVPKKKTSKSKRNKRKATWTHKAVVEAQKALSLGKSILSGRSKFVYPTKEEESEDQ